MVNHFTVSFRVKIDNSIVKCMRFNKLNKYRKNFEIFSIRDCNKKH